MFLEEKMQKTVKNNALNERISNIISHLGLTQTAFAKSLGTSTSRITNITQARNKPDSQLLASIAETYPEIDAVWLLTGQGEIDRNVKFSRNTNAEIYTENGALAGSENPYPNPYQTHIQPQKNGGKQGFVMRTLEEANRQNVALKAENEEADRQKQVFLSHAATELAQLPAWQLLLDSQQRQQASSVQQRLDKTLSRLRKVQELTEDLLGIRMNYKEFEALKQRIVRRLRFTDEDPFDKMTETDKIAHNAARERLLEQCEAELDHHLQVLFMGISYGKTDKANPRKGSAAEVLKDLLEKRRKEGGKWGALIGANEDAE